MASDEQQQNDANESNNNNSDNDDDNDQPDVENEETIHERLYRERRQREMQPKARVIKESRDQTRQQQHHKAHDRHHNHHHNHHHHHNRHQQTGHTKEMIKPDPTIRRARSAAKSSSTYHIVHSPVASTAAAAGKSATTGSESTHPRAAKSPVRQVVTVVGEEQLQRRLMQSVSEKRLRAQQLPEVKHPNTGSASQPEQSPNPAASSSSTTGSGSSNSDSRSHSSGSQHRSTSSGSSSSAGALNAHTTGFQMATNNTSMAHQNSDQESRARSPPIAAIIIPAEVARSLSMKAAAVAAAAAAAAASVKESNQNTRGRSKTPSSVSGLSQSPGSQSSLISREQLDYGTLLKSNEVQVLYRSPEPVASATDRHLKDEQARQVAPSVKQSPIAIMSINPAYELHNKPLVLEYPATVENLRLNNTGFSWEVKIPYQISMTTALYGAHLNQAHRFRLDQFHCHWGGSEHTVDNHSYTAELHFVHYNMEKYHTLSKAARHSDGLVVMSVFVDAHKDHHNHAELDKIVNHLKSIQLKGEHAIIRQAVRIENLLPTNRSYWSYQGSLTTPPYLESVTWFVLKYPIRCNTSQIDKFKSLRSSVRRDDDQVFISSNFRPTQPLHGRTVVTYDEPMGAGPTPRQAT